MFPDVALVMKLKKTKHLNKNSLICLKNNFFSLKSAESHAVAQDAEDNSKISLCKIS